MDSVLAIILGGGKGTRLYPLTKYRSKPAVPIGGKYRLIDVPLSNCIHSGLNRVYVLTQFMSVSLNRHISMAYSFDHLRRGFIDIIPATQSDITGEDWFQGTADAVRKSQMHFKQHAFSDYVILSGDHLYRMDYRQIVKLHRKSNADITVAAIPVEQEKVSEFGILKLDSDRRIVAFAEKPKLSDLSSDYLLDSGKNTHDSDPKYLASMGIYVFKRKVLDQLLEECRGHDFGKDIVPYSLNKRFVKAFIFDGYWEDVGLVSDFYHANIRLTSSHPPFNFYDPVWPVFSRPRHLPASLIDGTELSQTLICDGCRIHKAKISKSIIGLRSIISSGSEINDSLIMGADMFPGELMFREMNIVNVPPMGIGKDCQITRAIIDKNARIGNEVIITPKSLNENLTGEGYAVRNGITVIEKNAIIHDGTVI